MEIIDEDPAQRWISPGSQFCEKIGSIIVLSGDMMQLDPLEFVLELAHLLAICHHEGLLQEDSFMTWSRTNSKSSWT